MILESKYEKIISNEFNAICKQNSDKLKVEKKEILIKDNLRVVL